MRNYGDGEWTSYTHVLRALEFLLCTSKLLGVQNTWTEEHCPVNGNYEAAHKTGSWIAELSGYGQRRKVFQNTSTGRLRN